MEPIALSAFLEQVPKLHETERWCRLSKLLRYYEGTQYKDRPLDVSGFLKNSYGVSGTTSCSPPWRDRDPGAVWNLRKEVVQELTDWAISGDSWCNISIAEDAEADDWLRAVAAQACLSDVIADARDKGGAQGTAIVSMAIRDGVVFLETHDACNTYVLDWADEMTWRPRMVAKCFQVKSPVAKHDDQPTWKTRVWTDTTEEYYERVRMRSGEWVWTKTDSQAHTLGFCPVWWYPQFADAGAYDGIEDGPNTLDLIDDANYLAGAAAATTRRNADDILIIKENPSLNHGTVRKSATNALFSRGGAEYLSQDGASATVCETLAEKRAQRIYRASGVVIMSPEDVGKITSGEVIKRLTHRMLKKVSKIRNKYQLNLIIPICRGLLAAGRSMRGAIKVDPRVEFDEALGAHVVTERTPGKSNNVRCVWPEPFPPTFADKASAIDAAVKGTGSKAVIQQKTAIKLLQAAGIDLAGATAEEEIEGIEEDGERAAELSAKAIGMGDPGPGKAGPMTEEDDAEETDEEGDADETGGEVEA